MEFRRLSLPQWKAIKAIPYDYIKRWIVVGAYAIDAAYVLYINTEARWLGEPEGDVSRVAWGEVPPSNLTQRSGVEVVFTYTKEDKPLRFPDGSREADDLRAFVRSAADPAPAKRVAGEHPFQHLHSPRRNTHATS